MLDAYQEFLTHPSAESYLAAREALRQERTELGRRCDWNEIAAQCRSGQHAAVKRKLARLLPEWILSPRYHFYAGWVADEANDLGQVELERFQFQACLEGLFATGNGTVEQPYLATYTSDVRDLLDARRWQPQAQYCVEREGRLCDVVRVAGGRELWFDLAHVLHPLPARMPMAVSAK